MRIRFQVQICLIHDEILDLKVAANKAWKPEARL